MTYSKLFRHALIEFNDRRHVACLAARCVLGVDNVDDLIMPTPIQYPGYHESTVSPLLTPHEGVQVREYVRINRKPNGRMRTGNSGTI